MKKRLLPFLFLLLSIGVFSCAEEVLPVEVELENTELQPIEDEKSTDAEREEEGVDPDLG